MSEEKDAAAREALEAAIWRSGHRGTGQDLEDVLDALADWVDVIVNSRVVAVEKVQDTVTSAIDELREEVTRAQVAEVDDLQRQITELRRMPRSIGMGHGPGDLSDRSDFATDDASEPYPEAEDDPALETAAVEDFPDTWHGDPYGDALMAALEEAAEEQEIGGYVDVPGHGPVYLAPDADAQPLPIPYSLFHLTETDTIRIHPADYGILREYLRDGTSEEYVQALEARDVIGLEALSRTELVEAVKDAVACDPEVTLTGTAGPWPRPCKTCKQVLGQEEFKRDRSMADGYRSDCKTCIRKRNRERAQRRSQESTDVPAV